MLVNIYYTGVAIEFYPRPGGDSNGQPSKRCTNQCTTTLHLCQGDAMNHQIYECEEGRTNTYIEVNYQRGEYRITRVDLVLIPEEN